MTEKQPSSKLYVSGLPWKTTPEAISQYFSPAGLVVEVDIIRDRHSMRSKGFGFVTMGSIADATQAKEMFDGKPFGTRYLKIEYATPKEERPEGEFSRPAAPAPAAFTDASEPTIVVEDGADSEDFTSF
ncbi:RNA-binding protein [Candidatus Peribacteria bacterium]|nr:RNA-binding protein [Candidatus Peribacteria bacterium]